MKKVFTFVAAALCAVTMSAKVVVLDPSTQTPISTEDTQNGEAISLTIDGVGIAYNGTLNAATETAPADFRVFGNKTLTLSASSNITKVRIAGKANKAGFTASVDKGNITKGSSYEVVTTKESLEDPLIVVENINATSVTLTITKQLRAYKIEVTLGEGEGEGEGGGEGGEGDEIVVTGLNYVDAVFYEDETYGDYWIFEFYNDILEINEEYYLGAPMVFFTCEESTTSGTKIAGTWTPFESVYFATDDEEDEGVYTDEEEPVGSLTVTCVGKGLYNFVGSFVGEDGKTYKWDLKNMEVDAYNGVTYEDIFLDDDQPTSVENTEANVQSAIKTLRNGQVLIRKNNKVYTILGQEVK
ncbi:MAG: hypothetical protein MJZ53_02770 [Paludibacteraceae bacterium]|nr:hypothetical protein [Paludibacteraceae bacterium]